MLRGRNFVGKSETAEVLWGTTQDSNTAVMVEVANDRAREVEAHGEWLTFQ